MENNKLLAEGIAAKWFPDDAELRNTLTSDLVYFAERCVEREADEIVRRAKVLARKADEEKLKVCLNLDTTKLTGMLSSLRDN